ncbi:MAG: thiamine phosphate synthase [Fibrobacteres bacterium]|nr:thiamine phosphate synthase [Fibrobacterota bacterium]
MCNIEPMAIDFSQVHVYLVTDPTLCSGRSETEIIRGAAHGGLRLVQFRDKTCDARTYLEKARAISAVCRELGVWLLLNDRVDIAACVDCDGVHLGQGDLPTAEARALLGAGKIIGRSTHDAVQARLAMEAGADYINIGPVFPTSTKQVAVAPVGLDMVREVTRMANIPVTTMGGIGHANAREVVLAGADRVAVVTAITQAPDIAMAYRDLESLVRTAKADRQ